MQSKPLSWVGIVRLGLVQTALGAIVVLTTSTINRVMVVELALPAAVPGALVGLHYMLQVLRPRWGYGSDVGGRRTPWIVFGMAILAAGGIAASLATALFSVSFLGGLVAGIAAFTLVGVGIGAAGTNLLALLAARAPPERRAAAATIVWLMMIAGFIVTTIAAGKFLDPFSLSRLVAVTSTVSVIAFLLSVAASWGIEGPVDGSAASAPASTEESDGEPAFRAALREVWSDADARRFTIFVFISMLAYSMQDLILEPFAGIVFSLSPGETTRLSGLQHSGVFAGMIVVALAMSPRVGLGTLRGWVVGGCIASAAALGSLVMAGIVGPLWPLKASVFLLGLANGAFAVAAIGNMMSLAAANGTGRTGTRMGLWGAAQAIAFGIGGFVGAAAVDVIRPFTPAPVNAYTTVFAGEALLFIAAAILAQHAIGTTFRTGAARLEHRPSTTLSKEPMAAAKPG